jgi:opacity protein-like surface antigen
MKRTLLALALCALAAVVAAPVASAHDGRDPEDNFEVEGHIGFYWNLKFPTDVDESPVYTSYLNSTIAPPFHDLFRPEIRSKDFRWHLGLRISGDFSPRWSLEYTFDVSQGDNFRFQRGYLETTVPAAAVLVPGQVIRRLREDSGRILLHHANVVFHTRDSGKLVPYLTGGLTVIQYGEGPLIDFQDTGSGQFGVFDYPERHTKVGGNLGGGVKYYATRHVGVRVDARFVLTPSRFTQRGATNVGAGFGPDVTQIQTGLYSNLHISFGLFGRF